MGFLYKWFGILPKDNSDCLALNNNTDGTSPVRWVVDPNDETKGTCEKIEHDKSLLININNCKTTNGYYDFVNNKCETDIGKKCEEGNYYDYNTKSCVEIPQVIKEEINLPLSKDKLNQDLLTRIQNGFPEGVTLDINSCQSLIQDNSFNYIDNNGICKSCPVGSIPDANDICKCPGESYFDIESDSCKEDFTNRIKKLSDFDMFLIILILVFLYINRKKIMKMMKK